MYSRIQILLAVSAFCLAIRHAEAQETPPGTPPPRSAPAGVDKKYFDLSQSKDPKTKGLAERYLNLVKFQDWGTASGKSVMAKYVRHDADLRKVKLAVPKGTGKDRVVQEYDVEVDKLSKTGQARVKQIDMLQKKLDELAATAPKGDTATQTGPVDERGLNPRNAQGPEGRNAGPGEARPQATQLPAAAPPDPSESDPDPLGFAELQPVAAPAAGRESAPAPGRESAPAPSSEAAPTR